MRFLSLVLFLFSTAGHARTPLYREPDPTPAPLKREPVGPSKAVFKRKPDQELSRGEGVRIRSWTMAEVKQSPIVASQGASLEAIRSLKAGEIKTAIIHQSLIALYDAKSPVSANVELKSGEKFTLIGEATLERNSKRILVEFNKLSRARESNVFDVKAHALDAFGIYGVEGEYHSGSGKLFLAELLAAGAAGYADASVNRSQNVLGQTIEENSADTNSKKAVATAMNRTADRFAEKVRQAPEFSILRGPAVVQVIFLDQPTRNK